MKDKLLRTTTGGGAVVSVWPSRANALAFWNSEEYAQVRKLREWTGEFQVVLVDGQPVDAYTG